MDKRLAKRHKRQVSRAKKRLNVSQPDVRTPEELKAARDASRPAGTQRKGGVGNNAMPANRNQGRPVADTAVKGEA